MAIGTVKKIVLDRGFGFIGERGGPDHFFHYRDLAPSLLFDEALLEREVAFDVMQSPKGTRAANIKPARD